MSFAGHFSPFTSWIKIQKSKFIFLLAHIPCPASDLVFVQTRAIITTFVLPEHCSVNSRLGISASFLKFLFLFRLDLFYFWSFKPWKCGLWCPVFSRTWPAHTHTTRWFMVSLGFGDSRSLINQLWQFAVSRPTIAIIDLHLAFFVSSLFSCFLHFFCFVGWLFYRPIWSEETHFHALR